MSSIPKLLKLKDYVTLTGTTLGIMALCCAVIGRRDFISLGFFFVTISVGTDLIDGYIARKTGTANDMGRELDSLSDSLTFGIAPAVLTFQAFRTGGPYDFILLIGSIIFAWGAILRLARFNITEAEGYIGVPTPLSALLLINFFYLNYFFAFAYGGGGLRGIMYPMPEISYYIIPIIMIFIAYCNITIRISFTEKGKFVYNMFMVFAPVCPILGVIGALNPNFVLSMVVFAFFLSAFLIELVIIIIGFFKKKSLKG